MRKSILATLILIGLASNLYAKPRTMGIWKTAGVVAASVTPTFNPTSGCIYNTDATNDIYVDITGATAVITTDGSSWRIPAGKSQCWGSDDRNVLNIFAISYVSSAGTPVLIINLFRGN